MQDGNAAQAKARFEKAEVIGMKNGQPEAFIYDAFND